MDTGRPANANPAFERLLETLRTPSHRPAAAPISNGFAQSEPEPSRTMRERERRRAIELLYERIANKALIRQRS